MWKLVSHVLGLGSCDSLFKGNNIQMLEILETEETEK